jgi:hypothetical protein
MFEILRSGVIRPSLAPMTHRSSTQPRATIKGPWPAVCFTEQPLWGVIAYRDAVSFARYSGYGIAYHKCLLYGKGARPVMYGTTDMLGVKIKPGEQGYTQGYEIFRGGLPPGLQYLWVRYDPAYPGTAYPVDFTWEREWRFSPQGRGDLPVAIPHGFPGLCGGALVVEKDVDVPEFQSELVALAAAGHPWPQHIGKIISLETVRRLVGTDGRYGRIETYPY